MRHDNSQSEKIFVALSGGVDSSVAAALLQRDGYDVTGVFIKVWQPDFLECTWREERRDAMRVCATLGIPALTYDFSEEYERDVAHHMICEYRAGRTPNPDVMCNTAIKFDAFLKQARKDGAERVATGHYVAQQSSGCLEQLKAAADEGKDQSYFLWGLTQDVLKYTRFPLGTYRKESVRELAAEFGLATARKKDSQGVCFLGKLNMKEFLSHYISPERGPVLDRRGDVIGEHDGACFYTLGQRHGFRVTAAGEHKPHFVVGKDISNNTLTVSTTQMPLQPLRDVRVASVNWISGTALPVGTRVMFRTRYRGERYEAVIARHEGAVLTLLCDEDAPLAAAGQSLVMYACEKTNDRGIMLGGGILT